MTNATRLRAIVWLALFCLATLVFQALVVPLRIAAAERPHAVTLRTHAVP